MGLEERWQGEPLAQVFHVLVRGKARTISRDFKKYSARFAEIQSTEVVPVDDGSDINARTAQVLLPLAVLLVVRRSVRDMMDAANSLPGGREIGLLHHMNFCTDSAGASLEN